MQTRPLLAALVLLAPFAGVSFGTAATAAEPDFQATVAGARAAAFQDYLPVAQLGELAGFDRGWSVNTFYVVWTGERPALTPHYVARRQIGGQNTSGQTSPTTELWADSRTCQGLIPVLTAMEQLPDARADIPDLGRETTETAAPVPAGVRLTLWNSTARAGANAAVVELEISGNADTPMAKWWGQTQRALSGCWTSKAPAA